MGVGKQVCAASCIYQSKLTLFQPHFLSYANINTQQSNTHKNEFVKKIPKTLSGPACEDVLQSVLRIFQPLSSFQSYEEKMARAVRARRRFKAIVSLVMANRYWLEDVEDAAIGDNITKNVKLLTRKKDKMSMLTLQVEINISLELIEQITFFRRSLF